MVSGALLKPLAQVMCNCEDMVHYGEQEKTSKLVLLESGVSFVKCLVECAKRRTVHQVAEVFSISLTRIFTS